MNIEIVTTYRYGTNCYLLCDEESAVIVDPGEPDKRIIDFARVNQGKTNKLILLTHCHFDHISGITELGRVWQDAVIVAGFDEVRGLADNSINLSGIWSDEMVKVAPHKTVNDNDKLTFGRNNIRIITSPGHTVGSVCYLINDMLFSGDLLFKGSIGRTDLPTADYKQMISSLKKISDLSPQLKVMPGHGTTTTIGDEIKSNPYL